MLYHVSRNGQTFGPYTLEELRRYVLSGNVLLTDLTKNESMPEWLPVQQILGTMAGPGPGGLPSYTPFPATYAATDPNAYPDPPNLSWVLVLLFSILTCGLFMIVWNIVVATWIRRVQPHSQGLLYYLAGVALLVASSGASFGLLTAWQHHHTYGHHPLASLIGIAGWVVRLAGLFVIKASLEEHYNGPEPIGLRLSNAMTLFFGGLYLQYHLSRIHDMRQAIRFQRASL